MVYTELIQEAIAAGEKAYAPYSDFKVGAALLGVSGQIYTGCNVENASYGAGICAERTAVVKAISQGEQEFLALAVYGRAQSLSNAQDESWAFPCGICRQFLNEFCGNDFPIIVVGAADKYIRTTLGELLPNAFGPENL